ncbi:hypothetical protein PLESTB_000193800 [Pleodorina starrii]|uniref:Charged multivesicular body protein 5 n=1 Tax=Pleodorina starrii TaxID=330485 RepID=A0A9W6BCG6_9CHLO|nr:hypothetical protein PLESTM_000337500 [Pleodorina starrii]GLC49205.1 hypothetical protein PLESTB_000193800 [Pleodorina starrii]GLC73540.1 hypothetical protein PLESTF_001389000 [Pleodorina starrii]
MRRIFGAKKEAAPTPTLDETNDRLTTRGDKTDEKIKALDEQLAKYKEQIKKTRPGPAQDAIKRRALQVLKQRKLYESQREQLYQQQYNIEQTRFTVDSVKDTVSSVQALKAASKEMKSAFKKNKELDISYIENMQDEMFDMMDMANEINEAMGRSYAIPDDVDESDLMAELDALEADLAVEDAGKEGPSYLQEPDLDLPAVPNKEQEQAQPSEPLRS